MLKGCVNLCRGVYRLCVSVKSCYLQSQSHTTSFAISTVKCTSCSHPQAAVELCWLTCISSELNGAELTRSGGILIMGRLLSRCCTVLPSDVHATEPTAVVATHALRAFGGMAAFKHAREELAERSGRLLDLCALPDLLP